MGEHPKGASGARAPDGVRCLWSGDMWPVASPELDRAAVESDEGPVITNDDLALAVVPESHRAGADELAEQLDIIVPPGKERAMPPTIFHRRPVGLAYVCTQATHRATVAVHDLHQAGPPP